VYDTFRNQDIWRFGIYRKLSDSVLYSNIVTMNGDSCVQTAGWDDIGYNYLVGEDGNVYEGRGWNHQGAHVKEYNSVSLGFSVIGDYSTRLPNKAALNTVKQLISCALQKVRTSK